jgi:RNA polymerase sigma-70 factor (ECF subfamily)
VAANRCAIDQQRASKSQTGPLERLYPSPDPELDLIKLHDQTALREVLQAALQGLAAPERNLLKLHYVESISLEKLAVMEGMSRATVARKLAAARATVLTHVRAGLRQRLGLSARELESLLRFVRSRLELSLRRVLESPPTPRPDP